MEYGARPLRSVKRLENKLGERPCWYHIANAAAGAPTQVSIYDEIGFYGVSAGSFLADLKGVNGDIELHISSPGGDVFDGIAIYNQLKQRAGTVHVVVDGLAASAASFIAQAASPGKLEVAPHSRMMIHNGFSMAIGDAKDLRQTADLLDAITAEIASIYAERSGRPADHWLALMADETWFSDKQAVAEGLADAIHGQEPAKNEWDLTVYAKGQDEALRLLAACSAPVVDAATPYTPEPYSKDADETVQCPVCHEYNSPDARFCDQCGAKLAGRDDVSASLAGTVLNADGGHAPMTGTHSHAHTANGDQGDDDTHGHEHAHDDDADHGHTHDDPDGDGDDDTTAEGDTDHDYAGATPPKKVPGNLAGMFPVLAAEVDRSEWDAAKAWAAAAASDDPAAFYAAICAGRRPGDPATAEAWALPYRYSPSGPPNAAAVRDGLARLPDAKGLTNTPEAESTLLKLMRQVTPDYDPDALLDPALVASVLTVPDPATDLGEWDAAAVLMAATASADPAWYFRQVCAGRRPGDPATPDAWALPYRRTPTSPPNASAVRKALAELPLTAGLTNVDEARSVLDRAMRAITPASVPDDEIDPALLSAAFAVALG